MLGHDGLVEVYVEGCSFSLTRLSVLRVLSGGQSKLKKVDSLDLASCLPTSMINACKPEHQSHQSKFNDYSLHMHSQTLGYMQLMSINDLA